VLAEVLLERVGRTASAGRCFGPPIERDGTTYVPVAVVIAGGGAGERDGDDGGGFGFWAQPLGVYVLRDGRARFRPALGPVHLAVIAVVLRQTVRWVGTRRPGNESSRDRSGRR
jgi:uncharacterized spore protein YtfJ